MKKSITFIMSSGPRMTVSEEIAKDILNSEKQVVPIMDTNGWTGKIINKAHIVSSDYSEDTKEELKMLRANDRNIQSGLLTDGPPAKTR